MHKPIFDELECSYKTNPISEYNKIIKILNKDFCNFLKLDFTGSSIYSLKELFSEAFKKSEILSTHYVDFENCLSEITTNINKNINNNFDNLAVDIKDKLFDEYFNFCEIIFHMISIVDCQFNESEKDEIEWDQDLINQINGMINNALKSMNYKIIKTESNIFNVIKIDLNAEIVAAQSDKSIKETILLYLATRDNKIEDKKSYLLKLINLLEPVFKQYNNEPISSVKEYAQLLRHPVMKKTENKYKWFYENECEYLDKLFSMCLFVQHYAITKNTLKDFNQRKNNI